MDVPMVKVDVGEDEQKGVEEVLKSGMLAQGRIVEEFEKKFADYIGVKYAVATSNGTSALHTALLSAGIKHDDEVLVPSFTFIATANAVRFCNAKPVFVDINEDDFNMSIEDLKKKITPKTKAIIPVHLYGTPANMKEIMEIAEEHDLIVIEDACQAHGAEFNNKKVGSFGIGTFSFYPTKNMTTGEGGMITTNSKEIYEKAIKIRNHGMIERYHHEIVGYNYRMTNINAAIGIPQLKRLDANNLKRIKNADRYDAGLRGIPGIILPKRFKNRKQVFHQYTIRVTEEFGINRDELAKGLKEKGIGTGIYYPIPIHMQKAYEGFNVSLPVTEKLSKEVLSLPIHPSLKDEEIDYVIEKMKEFSKR